MSEPSHPAAYVNKLCGELRKPDGDPLAALRELLRSIVYHTGARRREFAVEVSAYDDGIVPTVDLSYRGRGAWIPYGSVDIEISAMPNEVQITVYDGLHQRAANETDATKGIDAFLGAIKERLEWT